MEISVKGHRVLITAAASGIGYAFAKAFLDYGARVHICDVKEDLLAECKNTLPDISVTLADVSDPAQVDQLFEETAASLGGLDVLINNFFTLPTVFCGHLKGPLQKLLRLLIMISL